MDEVPRQSRAAATSWKLVVPAVLAIVTTGWIVSSLTGVAAAALVVKKEKED